MVLFSALDFMILTIKLWLSQRMSEEIYPAVFRRKEVWYCSSVSEMILHKLRFLMKRGRGADGARCKQLHSVPTTFLYI